MIEGRELGCKTVGCGIAILIVMGCFYGMMVSSQSLARKIKEKRTAQKRQTAAQNLQLVAIPVGSYEAATGRLPPTTSPAAFRNALSPRYLSDTSVLLDPATGKPFLPNPAVSAKDRSAFRGRDVPLLATEPDTQGNRTILLLSGEVKEVYAATWESLTAPRTSRPAPKTAPVSSPLPGTVSGASSSGR